MSQMWSHPWIAAVLAAAVRGAPLILLAGAAALGWRRSSAATRHMVWLVAIAAMLSLPLLSASLPAWRVVLLPAVPEALSSPDAASPVFDMSDPATTPVSAEQAALTSPQPDAMAEVARAPAQGAPARDWGRIAFLIWCAGVALVALPMLLGHGRVWALSQTARPAEGSAWSALASSLPRSLGLAGKVRIMVSDRATMPMAFGIVNPTVLLPADAEQWPFERRRDVMLHELAHVARRDCLTQLVAQVTCALYWFDPLVWIAARALRGERERACDDAVVRAGSRPSEYATYLLQTARDLRVPRTAQLATVCMARRSQLSERLLAILDARRSRHTVSRRFAVPAWILAAVVVIPAAAFMPARAIATLPIIVEAIVPSEAVVAEGKASSRRASRTARAAPREVRFFTASDLLGEPTQCDYGKKKGNTSISRQR